MTVIRILLVLTATAALVLAGFFALRRPDISDPAVLANMPGEELRDVEVITLIRTAFRTATKVTLIAEIQNKQSFIKVVVDDRGILNDLADSFYVGHDEIWPKYPSPGTTYGRIEFDGPYQPHFFFSDDKHISIFEGRNHVPTPGKFAVKISDLLGLAAAMP